MKNLTLSIVLATYNGESFLAEQLQSYLEQSVPPDELVVCDDQSTDGTIRLLRQFAAKAPFPVKIHENPERLGYGDNFLKACSLASCDLIAFSDQDDVWLPRKLDLTKAEFLDDNVVMCAHAATLIDGAGLVIGTFTQGIIQRRVVGVGALPHWSVYAGFSVVIRRSLLQIIEGNRRGSAGHTKLLAGAHDRWIYFLANAFGSTALLPQSLALYRQHQANQFGSGTPDNMALLSLPLAEIARKGAVYSAIASHRADLLDLVADGSKNTETSARAKVAAEQWRNIEKSQRKRYRIYHSPSSLTRMAHWLENLKGGCYRADITGVSPLRAAGKDFVCIFKRK